MKSPEEQIDEALREALKRKFDNFERVPDPSLSEKIWRALNISDNPGIIQQSIILGLLFLIIVTGTLLFSSVSGDEHENLTNKSRSFIAKTEKPFAGKTKEYSADTETKVLLTDAEPTAPTQEKTAIANVNRKAAQVNLAKNHVADNAKVSFGKERKLQVASTLTFKKPAQNTAAAIGQFENAGNEVFGSTAKDFAGTTTDNSAEIDVNLLEKQPLHLPQLTWNTDSIISVSESKERIAIENKNDWAFIVSVAPLRTFQTLTIGHTDGIIYQNFRFPTSISAQTLGYKFTAGIEKNGFQLLVNYGKFRQSFKYEIARDEYLLQPDESGEYKVVRKGTPVEENSVSNLVGLSIKKHMVRKSTFLKNYFGDVGAELNRNLNSGNNMVWINGGFGKELFVDRNTRITVGPYIEYSLMKLRNDKNQFRVQPYQIGLSVGLKYLKK